MQTIDTLKTMVALLPQTVCDSMAAILRELTEYFDGATIETVSFTRLWDYPIFLVETVRDLSAICAADSQASLLVAPSGAFDIARWTEDGAYAVLGTIETALGGPQYVIPKAIADQCANVAESIRLAAASSDKEQS